MAKRFRFKNYDRQELDACGEALARELGDLYDPVRGPEPTTGEWTDFILDWFAAVAAEGLLVDARPRNLRTNWRHAWKMESEPPERSCAGEFMVDLTHSTYPTYHQLSPDRLPYWKVAVEKGGGLHIKLALESEWGEESSEDATAVAVLEDAIKIAAMRAQVKVMVYGCEDKGHHSEILDLLRKLRTQTADEAPWLCVSVPWSVEGWEARYEVLHET